MWRFRILLFSLALVSLACSAEEARRFSHFVHQSWTGNEAPAPVTSMTQGGDGFLWLATGEGLFRFDGLRFERVDAGQDAPRHDVPTALLATRRGDVWTYFEMARRFAVYRRGMLSPLQAPIAPARILEMVEGRDGAIWALTSSFDAELLRFKDGHWRVFNADDGLPRSNATNLQVTADGAVWLACTSSVARLAPGAERFEIALDRPHAMLSTDGAGRLWLSDDDSTYPVTGPGGRGLPEHPEARYPTADMQIESAPVFDREGSLWIATRYHGIMCLPAPGQTRGNCGADTRRFTRRDGLSSDATNQVMQDREGNVWVGTESGLDRLRPAALVAEPALTSPAVFGDKLLEAADGSIYIGQARTLYRVRPGGVPEPILGGLSEPESLCEAPDGAIWIGLDTRILVWKPGGVTRTIARPDAEATHNIIYDCAFDADGDFWISASGSGLHRYRQGRWQTVLEPGDQDDFHPTTMVRTPRGGVVVQRGDHLVWVEAGRRTTTPLQFGTIGMRVLTLRDTADAVLAAGAFGVSRYRDGRVDTALNPDASGLSRISGVVRTPDGATWLAYPRALVRLGAAELERAFAVGVLPRPSFSLGPGDGLLSRPHSHSQRSMVRGGDGRLWITTAAGTLWMDPARLLRNAVPPSVSIRSLTADGRSFRDPVTVSLAHAADHIEIDFAVLSFADPGRVHVRYRLEGFDRDWIDPGTRRQAFYTNLPPGTYRFRVIGANGDGVWNRTGSAVSFEVPPRFTQSPWFLLLCATLALAVLWMLYRLRVARIAGRIRSRLEERIAERERIARELHHTLLQGIQGLILRFQSVADRIGGEPERGQLEAALAAAEHVVVDARNRVHDLRDGDDSGDLCATIEKLVSETPFDPAPAVRIVVEGRPRPLHPLVAPEIARIVREALLNVAYHAHASWVEIAIGFEARHLAIRLRDNGVGIPADVRARGRREGHYGMIGMRERAGKIGGSLVVSSGPDGGSDVVLALPAHLAFARRSPPARSGRWRFFKRKQNDE